MAFFLLFNSFIGNATEQTMGPNTTLQPRALQLIDDIRAKVHAACGATVSDPAPTSQR